MELLELERFVRSLARTPMKGEPCDGGPQTWTEGHAYEKLMKLVEAARAFYPDEDPAHAPLFRASSPSERLKTYFLEIENDLPVSGGVQLTKAAERTKFVREQLDHAGVVLGPAFSVRETGGYVAIDTAMKTGELQQLLTRASVKISNLRWPTPGELAAAAMGDELGHLMPI